jgi:hypothetical protein
MIEYCVQMLGYFFISMFAIIGLLFVIVRGLFTRSDYDNNYDFPKRKTVTLCGSTRFKNYFELANREETMKGNIVLSVGCFGHKELSSPAESQKRDLDLLHLDKIRLSDEILVLDINGYIGESTRKEIQFAIDNSKTIRYWSDREND